MQQFLMSLKHHQYMLSINSSWSILASQYYAITAYGTTGRKPQPGKYQPIFSSAAFSTLVIAVRIGKSSFQLWQVIIVKAFILISSNKKNPSGSKTFLSRWVFVVLHCEDRAAHIKKK